MTLAPPPVQALPAARRPALRLVLLGRCAVVAVTALLGLPLCVLWVVFAALSPLTLLAPLLVPLAALVRGFADAHRRDAGRLLGTPVRAPYRSTAGPGLLARVATLLRDPATWRDAVWLPLHAVVGFATSLVSLVLLLGSVFYACYPFLFWLTPQRAFGHPFGDAWHLHTVAQAAVLTPLAPVLFALWWVLAVPLARLDVSLTRALLGARAAAGRTG